MKWKGRERTKKYMTRKKEEMKRNKEGAGTKDGRKTSKNKIHIIERMREYERGSKTKQRQRRLCIRGEAKKNSKYRKVS